MRIVNSNLEQFMNAIEVEEDQTSFIRAKMTTGLDSNIRAEQKPVPIKNKFGQLDRVKEFQPGSRSQDRK